MSDELWKRNEFSIRVEADTLGEYMAELDRQMIGRMLRPWEYPDSGRRIIPKVSLFPRGERAWNWSAKWLKELDRRQWATRQALMGRWYELEEEFRGDC